MQSKYFTAEQIISTLREAEELLSQRKTAAEACRALNASEQAYSCWRKKHGCMSTEQAQWLQELEKEDARCIPRDRRDSGMLWRLSREQIEALSL
jgi:hypothetical protein